MPLTDSTGVYTFTGAKGATSNATPQTVVPDPGTGANVFIIEKEDFGVLNEDTASVTIIVTLTGGTPRVIERTTLISGDHYLNPSRWICSPGETITVQLAATVATTQPTWLATYFQITN